MQFSVSVSEYESTMATQSENDVNALNEPTTPPSAHELKAVRKQVAAHLHSPTDNMMSPCSKNLNRQRHMPK